MSNDTVGYVNLDYAAAHATMMRDDDDRFYEKKLQLAIDGFKELNIGGTFPSVRVAYLTVSEQNTIMFPFDYVDYILIGINNGGRIWTLTRNLNLMLPANQSCGEWYRPNLTTTSNESGQGMLPDYGYTFSQHDYNGQTISGAYALGGGFNEAYYRIDHANRQIIFLTDESLSGLTVILEYKSSGINKNTIVPLQAVPALDAYIHWKLAIHDRQENMNNKMMFKEEWLNEKGKLRSMMRSFTIDEFLDQKYLALSQGVKR